MEPLESQPQDWRGGWGDWGESIPGASGVLCLYDAGDRIKLCEKVGPVTGRKIKTLQIKINKSCKGGGGDKMNNYRHFRVLLRLSASLPHIAVCIRFNTGYVLPGFPVFT